MKLSKILCGIVIALSCAVMVHLSGDKLATLAGVLAYLIIILNTKNGKI